MRKPQRKRHESPREQACADVILRQGATGPAVDITTTTTTKVVSLIRDRDRG